MAGSKRCPECGTPVKVTNLADHYGRVHPRAKLKLSKEEQVAVERASVRRDRPTSHADWRGGAGGFGCGARGPPR